MKTTNLWVKETYIDRTQDCRFGDADWFETFTDNLSALYKSLQKEYGKAQNIYCDTAKGETKKVGWIFTKRVKYEDSKNTYLREVWVEVATTKPIKQIIVERPKFS